MLSKRKVPPRAGLSGHPGPANDLLLLSGILFFAIDDGTAESRRLVIGRRPSANSANLIFAKNEDCPPEGGVNAEGGANALRKASFCMPDGP